MDKLPMNRCASCLLFLLFALPAAGLAAEQASHGPVITGYGPVFDIASTRFEINTAADWKVLFDVAGAGSDRSAINGRIESLARFLNMHARAGVPVERMKLAVILHGGATMSGLSDAAYRERFGVDNPNTPLIEALVKAGVQFWQCGQSAAFNEVAADELSPHVGMALSAMTVVSQLQRAGYTLQP